MARWALGLAIVPIILTWLVSAVLAGIVLARSSDGRDHGQGLAKAALAIVGIWVIFVIGFALAS